MLGQNETSESERPGIVFHGEIFLKPELVLKMTQVIQGSRCHVTLGHSGLAMKLQSTAPVYPSWDGNYGLGVSHHERVRRQRGGDTSPLRPQQHLTNELVTGGTHALPLSPQYGDVTARRPCLPGDGHVERRKILSGPTGPGLRSVSGHCGGPSRARARRTARRSRRR